MNPHIEEKFLRSAKLSYKLVAVALFALLLQIPVWMISRLTAEREERQIQVEEELAEKWGARQYLTGPYLLLEKPIPDGTELLLPESLVIKTAVRPEIRYRGIFQAVLYQADMTLTGFFPATATTDSHIKCMIALPDLKGIRAISGTAGGEKLSFVPGNTPFGKAILSGSEGTTKSASAHNRTSFRRTSPVAQRSVCELGQLLGDLPLNAQSMERIPFEITISFNGTRSLFVDPLGDSNEIEFSGTWNSPKFTGAVLPSERSVSPKDFSAKWIVSNLNTAYPRRVNPTSFEPCSMSTGVEFVLSAGTYQQTERAIRYSLLFLAVFLFSLLIADQITGVSMHLIQYAVAACAPVVFYLLLLSLGEQTSFLSGYLLAAAATVILVGVYARLIFRKTLPALLIGLILAASYGVLLVILNAEDIALLAGSIAIFVMLAAVMALTGSLNRKQPAFVPPSERPDSTDSATTSFHTSPKG